MNTEKYRALNFEYAKKRNKALLEAERDKRELFENYPQLQEIEEQLQQIGLKLSKAILRSDRTQANQHIESLNQEINALKKRKRDILEKLKITENKLEPKYECLICLDTGFQKETGQMCSCYRQKLIDMAYRQSNLERIGTENFQTFNSELYSAEKNPEMYKTQISPRENILKIKGKCVELIEKFDNPEEKNLLFIGETGLGKTFLSNCIANEILKKGKTVIYQTAPRLLDLIMDYKMRYERPENFDDEEYNNLFEVNLLIIDDLGAEALNTARLSELFTIINTRLLTQKSKCTKTLLSTNLSLEEMGEYYDDRIMSRILGEFYKCKFFGENIRLKKH